MKKVETYLPVFPGFYNTIFEADEQCEVDNINYLRAEKDKKPARWEEINFDYKEYMNEVGKHACDYIEEALSDIIKVKVKFQEVCSPREYNFANDSIHCEITIAKSRILEYLSENFESYSAHVRERYTSYSGFVSFYPNDATEWLKLIEREEKYEHVIGAVLDFICENEEIDAELMYYYCMEKGCSVYATNFEELTA